MASSYDEHIEVVYDMLDWWDAQAYELTVHTVGSALVANLLTGGYDGAVTAALNAHQARYYPNSEIRSPGELMFHTVKRVVPDAGEFESIRDALFDPVYGTLTSVGHAELLKTASGWWRRFGRITEVAHSGEVRKYYYPGKECENRVTSLSGTCRMDTRLASGLESEEVIRVAEFGKLAVENLINNSFAPIEFLVTVVQNMDNSGLRVKGQKLVQKYHNLSYGDAGVAARFVRDCVNRAGQAL